jgi:hypothetical protein
MMDIDGPGAVVRIWMTFGGQMPGEGILRFYLDGDSVPAIEGKPIELLSGGKLVGWPLSAGVSPLTEPLNQGHNFYLPIPYQSHCKITYETDGVVEFGNPNNEGESIYYLINYREYEPGTRIRTFRPDDLEIYAGKLEKTSRKLLDRKKQVKQNPLNTRELSFTLAPGENWSDTLNGPSAIRMIKLKLDAENLPQALRTTILEAEFDGFKTVWCPAGDFFGTGYLIRESDTWYTRVKGDGTMQSFWIMPFKRNAVISLRNIGDEPVGVNLETATSSWSWKQNSMHFGASWQQYTHLFTRKNYDEKLGEHFDLNYVELTGKGVYVGDVLTLFNTIYNWWGEGDEKIYLDGENFPSHFGTGTEDYYGYAWGDQSQRYSHPFIAQPDHTGNSRPGYVVNSHFRSLDALPFRQHLRLDMEMWHHNPTTVNYAPATFYYMIPGGSSNIHEGYEDARAKVALKKTDIISNKVIDGLIEAEHMEFRNSRTENVIRSLVTLNHGDVPLSNHAMVRWNRAEKGDTVFFSFVPKVPGKFNITGVFATSSTFNQFKVLLNGKEILGELNLFNDSRGRKTVHLGLQELTPGENTISFVMLNEPIAIPSFGFDCLIIE